MTIQMLLSNCLRIAIIKEMMIIIRLSQRRAESVVRYLIMGGIDPERLTPKGYGEQQPKTVTKFT